MKVFKKISEELERDYRGKFVAIEVDSGKKAREKYPGKVFLSGADWLSSGSFVQREMKNDKGRNK